MYNIIDMKNIAKEMNNRTYTDYFYRLMLIARSVFKWNNLPNGIDEKWIERYLFGEGVCVFFKDREKGFMVSKCNPSGLLNHYDEPTLVTPYGTNYHGEPLQNFDECVLIRNNDMMIPTAPTIELYAMRLAEIQRTMDVNISAQKTPYVILCSDKQKLSFSRVFSQINENEVAIFGDKNLDIENVKALKIDAPPVFDKLQCQKQAIWNECMTFLGVNNNTQESKRERLVVNEVEANNEQIEISANVMLKSRKHACELINEMFGLNISVEMRGTPKEADKDEKESDDKCSTQDTQ